jgi:Lipase (class 3)
MASTQDYATLSLYVYDVREDDINRPILPAGWTELELNTDNVVGFSYGIFQGPGNEIVLAYTGTNEGVDWLSNIGSGLGIGSPQVSAAALVYARAKEQYGANITLSGHSLGGGLASIISVWFNRPAVVFDHAPFELAARNPLFVQASKAVLAAAGYDLGMVFKTRLTPITEARNATW